MLERIKASKINLIILLIGLSFSVALIATYLYFTNSDRDSEPVVNSVEDSNELVCQATLKSKLVGTWAHADSDAIYPPKIEFLEDGSYVLTGWVSNNYESIGNWSFNESIKEITLDIKEIDQYWQTALSETLMEDVLDVTSYDPENGVVSIRFRYFPVQDQGTSNGCSDGEFMLNFFNLFMYKNTEENSEAKSVESNELTCSEIERAEFIGAWYFDFQEGDATPGTMVLFENGKFMLTGWRDPDFKTSGIWSYDPQTKIVIWEFQDQQEYWSWWLKPIDVGGFPDVISIEGSKVTLHTESSPAKPDRDCYIYINFFGSLFRHKVDKYDQAIHLPSDIDLIVVV